MKDMKKWEYKRVALNPSTASGIVKLDNYGENVTQINIV